MLSYREARKRGFQVQAAPRADRRGPDRRGGDTVAEAAARRALAGLSAVGAAAGLAGAAATDARELAERVQRQEDGLALEVGKLAKSIADMRAELAEVGAGLRQAVEAAATATSLAAQLSDKTDSIASDAEDAQARAGRALMRATEVEGVAREAGAKAGQQIKRAEEALSAQVTAVAVLARDAVAKAGVRVTAVTHVGLEGRSLVVKDSAGQEQRLVLPDEGRRARGATGVGGGLNRTKIIALVEERMNYSASEVLADQDSTGSVLTFTFASAVDKVVVELHETAADDISTARVRTDGTAPDADTGILIHAGMPHPIPDNTQTVKVLAANGKTVSVWGYRR